MKDGKLVRVKIESPDGDAVVDVRPLPLNKSLELGELIEKQEALRKQEPPTALSRAELKRLYELLAASIIPVSGLENAEGQALTAEDFQTLNVSHDIILAVTTAVGKIRSAGDSDGKNSSADASPVG